MEQTPSWQANRFSATQESVRILWNTRVQYLVYKRPPPVPILKHINPVRAFHPTSWRSILILSFHLCLGLPSGRFGGGGCGGGNGGGGGGGFLSIPEIIAIVIMFF